ncbi:MAG TPA: hypothetical protein VFS38_03410 [Actinomycetota bacterium]|nr:hypothetical protein [Actinomycetota bacterium]
MESGPLQVLFFLLLPLVLLVPRAFNVLGEANKFDWSGLGIFGAMGFRNRSFRWMARQKRQLLETARLNHWTL